VKVPAFRSSQFQDGGLSFSRTGNALPFWKRQPHQTISDVPVAPPKNNTRRPPGSHAPKNNPRCPPGSYWFESRKRGRESFFLDFPIQQLTIDSHRLSLKKTPDPFLFRQRTPCCGNCSNSECATGCTVGQRTHEGRPRCGKSAGLDLWEPWGGNYPGRPGPIFPISILGYWQLIAGPYCIATRSSPLQILRGSRCSIGLLRYTRHPGKPLLHKSEPKPTF
jgi:hypothetical protein